MTFYTKPSLTGYGSNKPSEDGASTAANEITLAARVSKLSGPLKTYAEAINTELVTILNTDPRYETGYTNVTMSNSTEIAINALNFIPSAVMFQASVTSGVSASWGFDTITKSHCIVDTQAAPSYNGFYVDLSYSIVYRVTDADIFKAKVSVFNNGGITMTVSRTGSPTGTLRVHWMILK